MPILNYTTKIAPSRTAADITELLVRKGAKRVTAEYDSGRQVGLSFVMEIGGLPVHFQLPANAAGVARVLLHERPWRQSRAAKRADYEARILARAEWVAWRILKDWIEAQLALIESGQAEMGQVFMPYAIDGAGRTMFELFVEDNQKRLGAGK